MIRRVCNGCRNEKEEQTTLMQQQWLWWKKLGTHERKSPVYNYEKCPAEEVNLSEDFRTRQDIIVWERCIKCWEKLRTQKATGRGRASYRRWEVSRRLGDRYLLFVCE